MLPDGFCYAREAGAPFALKMMAILQSGNC